MTDLVVDDASYMNVVPEERARPSRELLSA
jgi:hypothetical protein